MFNLLKVEFYKLRKFLFGYIAIIFMLVIGLTYGSIKLSELDINTADIFNFVVCDTSFVFVMSLVSALFIGKDFSSRTICNEIKMGYSRFQIMLSRMIAVCAFAVLLHMIYIISTEIGFAVIRGADTSVFCLENALWLLTVSLQLAAIISGVVLICFTARRSMEAITLSVMYAFIGCNILRNFFMGSKIFTASCFCFVQDNNTKNLLVSAIAALVTMFAFSVIAALSFNKADVK